MACKNCQDYARPYICPACNNVILNQCKTCHIELIHHIVLNQNIHICSSPVTGLETIEADVDMFKPSWVSM